MVYSHPSKIFSRQKDTLFKKDVKVEKPSEIVTKSEP